MTADRKKNRRFCMHPRAQSRSVACLFLILMLLAGGCSLSGADEFPTLETHASPVPGQSESVDQTDPSENAQTDPVSLSLAVPYGNDVADLLRLLFLARKSGLQPLGDGHSIGMYVQAEDLLQYDGPLQLSVQTVSASSGATDEQIKGWQASGLLPDVIYVREAAHAPGLGQLLDISKWVFADELPGYRVVVTGSQIDQPAVICLLPRKTIIGLEIPNAGNSFAVGRVTARKHNLCCRITDPTRAITRGCIIRNLSY